jgi:hypothetical protein
LTPNFTASLATLDKQGRVSLPKTVRDQVLWPLNTDSRHLLARVMGAGILKVCSPEATEDLKARWTELAQSGEAADLTTVARQQLPFMELRYERPGTRIVFIQAALFAMNFPIDLEREEPLYAQGSPDNGVILWTRDAFQSRVATEPF